MSIKLEIVTPERVVFTDRVDSVVLPTVEGEVGILEEHIPLIVMLEPGEVQITLGEERVTIAVDKGFGRVKGDLVSVLTEAAIDVKEIDLSEVHEAEERARKALEAAKKNKDIDPTEIEKLEAVTRFSLAQKLAKNRRL